MRVFSRQESGDDPELSRDDPELSRDDPELSRDDPEIPRSLPQALGDEVLQVVAEFVDGDFLEDWHEKALDEHVLRALLADPA